MCRYHNMSAGTVTHVCRYLTVFQHSPVLLVQVCVINSSSHTSSTDAHPPWVAQETVTAGSEP